MRRPLYGPGGNGRRRAGRNRSGRRRAGDLVDSRIADWALSLPDTVADNASSGAVVLGPWVPYGQALERLDLAGARASLSLNGTQINSGLGSAVMGDPAAAVAWLANALAPFGTKILPGHFVMSR